MFVEGKCRCSMCMQELECEDYCPGCDHDPDIYRKYFDTCCLPEDTILKDGRYRIGVVSARDDFKISYSAWDMKEKYPVTIRESFLADCAGRDVEISSSVEVCEDFDETYRRELGRFLNTAHGMMEFKELLKTGQAIDFFEENNTAYIVEQFVFGEPCGEPRFLPERTVLCGGKYYIGSVIGSGNFGITYAAWDRDMKAPIAIKEYFPRAYAQRDAASGRTLKLSDTAKRKEYAHGLNRFLREAQAMRKFGELPGVVNTYDFFEENNTAYIVMEYIRGVTLDAYITKEKPGTARILKMMQDVLESLMHIHAGDVIHRDITPKNLLVTEDGVIKVIDFGSARDMQREGTSSYATEHYAPPEQFPSNLKQGPWSDVYGVCATFYYALTGIEPQVSLAREYRDELKKPSELGIRLKKHQEKALMDGLEPDPEKRTRSAALLRSYMFNLSLPEDEIKAEPGEYTWELDPETQGVILRDMIKPDEVLEKLVMPAYIGGHKVTALADGFEFPRAKSIVLPMYLRKLGEGIRFPSELFEIDLGRALTAIPGGAFTFTKLTSVEFPDTVKTIGKEAFLGVPLERVSFPRVMTAIGDRAFRATRLREIELPAKLERIGTDVFVGTALLSLDFPEGTETVNRGYFENTGRLAYVVLPEGTKSIQQKSFGNCKGMKEIIIPSTVTYIDPNAFDGCEGLKIICEHFSYANHYAIKHKISCWDGLGLLRETFAFRSPKASDLPFYFPEEQLKVKAEQGDAEAEYALGMFALCDPEKLPDALEHFMRAADAGQGFASASALFRLGLCRCGDHGFRRDYGQAITLFTLAGKQGHETAQLMLGMIYNEGRGVDRDDKQAVHWYTLAAEQGNAAAQYNLGVCCFNGWGVDRDDKQAVHWYTLAAEQGLAKAQYNLGLCYENGFGVDRDYKRAMHWYMPAAEMGHPMAQNNLAVYYGEGRGTVRDEEKALHWLTLAAQGGFAEAQRNLGIVYAEGRGVDKDPGQAKYWLNLAAQQGHADAQLRMGDFFFKGFGVDPDYERALHWYTLAAEQGHAEAQNNLAVCFVEGLGTAPDIKKALHWFMLAVEQGYAEAQFNLGVIYAEGMGVGRDPEKAKYWLNLAAEKGFLQALELLETLKA